MASKPKVIGYVRVSTAEQVDGFGLDAQRASIRSYCRDEGLTLIEILGDEGISGSNGLDDRRGLAEALARIERGEATALVVYRLDRLARDLILQETIHARLETRRASVLSVSEPSVGDDATRTLIRQVMGVFAQYERTVIRGRMMAGKAEKKKQGGYVGGTPAYGFRAVDGTLVADEDERAMVKLITDRRRVGESYRTIAMALAEAGHTTRRGTVFNPAQIRAIALRNGG